MKFLSDILAKAGLTVDGVVTLNNTATGQTPDANDNSTKLATTAWVRGFVTPYTLPIASATTLGGIKIGSGLSIDGTGIVSVAASGVGAIRSLQQITASTGQTLFTVSGGYTPGLIDVFLNGVLLTPTAIDTSNGTTFTLTDPAVGGDLLDVFVYNPIYNGFISSTDQVPEGVINLYFTNARARTAISLTTTGVSGAASYDSGTGVLNIPNYQGLVPSGGITGDILAKVSGTDYDVTWIPNYTSSVKHYVKLGESMSAGTPVYVSGSTGNAGTNMIVSKASNISEGTSSKTIGLIATSGVTNDEVFVITEGLISGLDTSTAIANDPVWLGPNGTLIFGLANKPYAPAHLVFIGIVTRVQSNNGEIFVKVQNGFELDELHDLSVRNPSDGDMIKYVASTGLWTKIAASTTNIVEGTNLYYTDTRVNTYLTTNNYATQSYVSIAISNLVDSAPTTLDTLNELAAALGDDPNFATTVAASIGTKVPLTRTITINGTSYDLSADRTWNIAAGVTSFNTRTGAITPATGDYTTAQVTESGNLYYTDARARLSISLTTTGTSGAATYDSVTGILNIPQYQGGVTSFNTRTGAITLSDTDVITALTYTPVTNARTLTINGTTYDLSANRTWSIAAGLTSFNTRTGDITLTSGDVTTALGYTPVTNARTLTINGTAYDLTADRSWTVGVNPSARTIQTYTATASQTTFTVTGGYVIGLVDVFINGVRLTSADFTATDGSTVVLATGTGAGNIVDVIKYTSAFTASSALRQVSYFTATAGQTSFTVSYTPGLVDIFYNGSKLASSEYTASNGTSVVLSSGAALNDIIEVVAYAYSVGAFTGQAQLNGTGFVKVNGTTVSYDNSTYLTSINSSQVTTALGYTPYNATNPSGYITSSALSSYLPLSGGTLTGALSGTSGAFSGDVSSGGNLSSTGNLTLNTGANRHIQIGSATNYYWRIRAFNDDLEINGGANAFTAVKFYYPTGAATFSSSVTTTQVLVNESSPKIVLTPLSYSGSYRTVLGTRSGAEGVLQLGNNNPNYIVAGNTATGGSLHFYVNAVSDFITSTNGTLSLVLASTGAATFSSSVTVGTNIETNNGYLSSSAGSGTSYSSRLSTVYNYPYIETYLDSIAGASYEGRLLFRTNSGGGAMSTKLTIANSGLATFSDSIYLSKSVDPKIYSGTGIGLNIDGSALYLNRYSQSNIIMVPNGGNILIGTSTTNSYRATINGGSNDGLSIINSAAVQSLNINNTSSNTIVRLVSTTNTFWDIQANSNGSFHIDRGDVAALSFDTSLNASFSKSITARNFNKYIKSWAPSGGTGSYTIVTYNWADELAALASNFDSACLYRGFIKSSNGAHYFGYYFDILVGSQGYGGNSLQYKIQNLVPANSPWAGGCGGTPFGTVDTTNFEHRNNPCGESLELYITRLG